MVVNGNVVIVVNWVRIIHAISLMKRIKWVRILPNFPNRPVCNRFHSKMNLLDKIINRILVWCIHLSLFNEFYEIDCHFNIDDSLNWPVIDVDDKVNRSNLVINCQMLLCVEEFCIKLQYHDDLDFFFDYLVKPVYLIIVSRDKVRRCLTLVKICQRYFHRYDIVLMVWSTCDFITHFVDYVVEIMEWSRIVAMDVPNVLTNSVGRIAAELVVNVVRIWVKDEHSANYNLLQRSLIHFYDLFCKIIAHNNSRIDHIILVSVVIWSIWDWFFFEP